MACAIPIECSNWNPLLRVGLDNEFALHQSPMSGEGAEVGVATGLVGCFEDEVVFGVGEDHRGLGDDLSGVGDVVLVGGSGEGEHLFGCGADGFVSARGDDDEVVRELVRVGEADANGLTGIGSDG